MRRSQMLGSSTWSLMHASPISPFVVAVLWACFALSAAPAQKPDARQATWNQWRGPDRSGHSAGASWPKGLNKANFRQTWRVELGPSYSGPVVDDKRVYTTETVDRRQEFVRAYDRQSGELLWEVEWKGAMRVPFFASKNGSWIRSTPTLAGDSLFVGGIRDVLVCLDKLSGEERWRVDFRKRFRSPLPTFGCVCSPLVDGGAVYMQAGGGIVKLDASNGKTIWRSLEDGGGMMGSAFSSPVLATIRGKRMLLVQTRSELCGVDPGDGAVLWRRKVRTFRGMNILTPLPYKDGVFTSAYRGRAHYFAPRMRAADVEGDSVATEAQRTRDPWTVEEKWSNRATGYMTSPVVIGDHAYLFLQSKRFACVDLSKGEVCWITKSMRETYWSLVVRGERILALSDKGVLRLIQHDPEQYRELGRVSVGENTWAHLAVDGEQVFIRELNALAAYRWRDGDEAAPETRKPRKGLRKH